MLYPWKRRQHERLPAWNLHGMPYALVFTLITYIYSMLCKPYKTKTDFVANMDMNMDSQSMPQTHPATLAAMNCGTDDARLQDLIRSGVASPYPLDADDIHLPPHVIRGRVGEAPVMRVVPPLSRCMSQSYPWSD